MFAVILAGGLGVRLRPYTHTIPKPLLPLGDLPVLEILLRQLRAAGVTDVTLCLGYMASLFTDFVGANQGWGLNISCVVEPEPLGTAGPLRLAPNLPDDFLLLNGDTLTDLDFAAFYAAHRQSGAWATLFAPRVRETLEFGILELDATGSAVTAYIEKPERSFHVSSGVYALSRRILGYLPEGRFDMPDLIRRAIAERRPVAAQSPDAYWRDIGTPIQFESANRDFQDNPGRFLVGGRER